MTYPRCTKCNMSETNAEDIILKCLGKNTMWHIIIERYSVLCLVLGIQWFGHMYVVIDGGV